MKVFIILFTLFVAYLFYFSILKAASKEDKFYDHKEK